MLGAKGSSLRGQGLDPDREEEAPLDTPSLTHTHQVVSGHLGLAAGRESRPVNYWQAHGPVAHRAGASDSKGNACSFQDM